MIHDFIKSNKKQQYAIVLRASDLKATSAEAYREELPEQRLL